MLVSIFNIEILLKERYSVFYDLQDIMAFAPINLIILIFKALC